MRQRSPITAFGDVDVGGGQVLAHRPGGDRRGRADRPTTRGPRRRRRRAPGRARRGRCGRPGRRRRGSRRAVATRPATGSLEDPRRDGAVVVVDGLDAADVHRHEQSGHRTILPSDGRRASRRTRRSPRDPPRVPAASQGGPVARRVQRPLAPRPRPDRRRQPDRPRRAALHPDPPPRRLDQRRAGHGAGRRWRSPTTASPSCGGSPRRRCSRPAAPPTGRRAGAALLADEAEFIDLAGVPAVAGPRVPAGQPDARDHRRPPDEPDRQAALPVAPPRRRCRSTRPSATGGCSTVR